MFPPSKRVEHAGGNAPVWGKDVLSALWDVGHSLHQPVIGRDGPEHCIFPPLLRQEEHLAEIHVCMYMYPDR